jgi:DNA transposition AAA+ family ATPase
LAILDANSNPNTWIISYEPIFSSSSQETLKIYIDIETGEIAKVR